MAKNGGHHTLRRCNSGLCTEVYIETREGHKQGYREVQEVYWYRGIKVQRLHWSLVQRGTRRVVITYQGGVAERQQELLLES